MTATIATVTDILKEFYLGPIQEELNNETYVSDLFQKASVDWNGRLVHIPVHVARNTGVSFAAEGGALPAAGDQGYDALIATAKFLYGRFEMTGPAMAALGKGGTNSFVGYVDAEMTRLKDDVKNASNQAAVSGGNVIGYMSQQNAVSVGADDWMFDGDFAKATTLAAIATIEFDLVRMSDYLTSPNPLAAGQGIDTVDAANGTVHLTAALDTTAGAGGWNVALVDGDVYAVVVTGPAAVLAATADEPTGIYGNLSDPTHFGADRTTATGEASLQSNFINTVADGAGAPPAAPGSDRVALDLDAHFQGCLDEITLASGDEPDIILASPRQRSRYAAIVAGTIQADFAGRSKAAGADGGFTGFGYAGIPIKTSRHVGNGHLAFLKTASWKMCELEPMGFADLDGSVLSRNSGFDSWQGFVRWYYECVCTRPNTNAVVTGLAL